MTLWKSFLARLLAGGKPDQVRRMPVRRRSRPLGVEHLEDRVVPVYGLQYIPTIETMAGATVVIGSGTKLTDTATLSQGESPTGSITFTLTGPSNTVVDTETVAVNGDGIYTTPNGYLPTATGNYTWSATYSGDTNNTSVSDNGQNESQAVIAASPWLLTGAYPSAVTLSSSPATLQDIAALTGGYNTTGTITFTLNLNSQVVYTDHVSVAGNASGATVFYITTSGDHAGGYTLPTTGTVTGTYQWSATYSGDANNHSAQDQGGTAEQAIVSPATPTIATQASITAGGVCGTAKTTDTVTVTGGDNPTGTITFTLKAPDGTTSTIGTVSVGGDGTYNAPTSVPVSEVGTYTWHASYSGDSNNSSVQDNGSNESVTTVAPATGSISGTKYLDLTGNGFSCDDTGLGGVTIVLFKEIDNSGVLDLGDGSPIASTVTAANGTYSFTGLAAGTYFVEEVVPSGYVQTGGGSTVAPGGSAYYTVTLQSGQASKGDNFDDYKIPTCTPTNICYSVCNGNYSQQQYSSLTGNTKEGDSVTVTFTVSPGMNDQLSLCSYIAPGPSFSLTTAYEQQLYDVATGTFSAGTHSLTVELPNCYYQIDFVCGPAINLLSPPNAGPDYVNIDYNTQYRLLGHDNGGTQACSTKSICSGDFVSANFWTSVPSWLNPLNSSSSNLGQWLATSFPNLYGAGTGSHCMINSNGSYFSNSQVLSDYCKFSGGDQQVLSAALSVYFTSTNLSCSNTSWYNGFFSTSSAGSGMNTCNVGNNGAAFGLANNTTTTVMQLLTDVNNNTIAGCSVSSGVNTLFCGIN